MEERRIMPSELIQVTNPSASSELLGYVMAEQRNALNGTEGIPLEFPASYAIAQQWSLVTTLYQVLEQSFKCISKRYKKDNKHSLKKAFDRMPQNVRDDFSESWKEYAAFLSPAQPRYKMPAYKTLDKFLETLDSNGGYRKYRYLLLETDNLETDKQIPTVDPLGMLELGTLCENSLKNLPVRSLEARMVYRIREVLERESTRMGTKKNEQVCLEDMCRKKCSKLLDVFNRERQLLLRILRNQRPPMEIFPSELSASEPGLSESDAEFLSVILNEALDVSPNGYRFEAIMYLGIMLEKDYALELPLECVLMNKPLEWKYKDFSSLAQSNVRKRKQIGRHSKPICVGVRVWLSNCPDVSPDEIPGTRKETLFGWKICEDTVSGYDQPAYFAFKIGEDNSGRSTAFFLYFRDDSIWFKKLIQQIRRARIPVEKKMFDGAVECQRHSFEQACFGRGYYGHHTRGEFPDSTREGAGNFHLLSARLREFRKKGAQP